MSWIGFSSVSYYRLHLGLILQKADFPHTGMKCNPFFDWHWRGKEMLSFFEWHWRNEMLSFFAWHWRHWRGKEMLSFFVWHWRHWRGKEMLSFFNDIGEEKIWNLVKLHVAEKEVVCLSRNKKWPFYFIWLFYIILIVIFWPFNCTSPPVRQDDKTSSSVLYSVFP